MTRSNLWSLDKDQNIKALLISLEHRVGASRFHILDTGLHRQAIRIAPPVKRPEVSVYIYCYAQTPRHYGVDLEYPLLIEQEADDKTEHLNELSIEQALEKIITHLELEHY